MRFFDVEGDTVKIGERLTGFTGILSGQLLRRKRAERVKMKLALS